MNVHKKQSSVGAPEIVRHDVKRTRITWNQTRFYAHVDPNEPTGYKVRFIVILVAKAKFLTTARSEEVFVNKRDTDDRKPEIATWPPNRNASISGTMTHKIEIPAANMFCLPRRAWRARSYSVHRQLRQRPTIGHSGANLAIFCCPSLLQSLGDNFIELIVTKYNTCGRRGRLRLRQRLDWIDTLC